MLCLRSEPNNKLQLASLFAMQTRQQQKKSFKSSSPQSKAGGGEYGSSLVNGICISIELLLAMPGDERHKIANTLFYALAFSFSFFSRRKFGYFGKKTLGVFAIESWGISYWSCHCSLFNNYFYKVTRFSL